MKNIHYTSSKVRAVTFVVVAALIIITSVTWADLIATQDVANYGTFGQLNSAVVFSNTLNVQPYACAPTATANSLTYLANTYGISNLVQTGYDTVNTLAQDMHTANKPYPFASQNGTSPLAIGSGINTFVNDQGVSSSAYMVAANVSLPTANQIYNWLSDGDAVVLTIYWSGLGGGHVLSCYSIDIYTYIFDQFPTGSGEMKFMDPWGGAPNSSEASASNIVTASYTTQSDGTLVVTYAGGAAGSIADPDNPDRTASGIIAFADVIGVVPEPTTWAFLCVAIAMIGGLKRWRFVCLRKP